MAPVLVAHAAVLALVMTGNGAEVGKVAAARSLALFDVTPSVPRVAARPTPPPLARKVAVVSTMVPEPISLEFAQPDPAPMPILSEASLAPGESCDIAGKVQATLRDDPRSRAALAMLPRDARSVANAVMLWDGRWIAGTTTSTRYALDQIRTAMVATVASAPAPCRLEVQSGPRLMLLAGPRDTVLVVGSGRWRWTDMFGADGEMPTTITARVEGAPSPAT